MTFLIISLFASIILITATISSARTFKERWNMPKGLYFKAGITFLAIGIFLFAIMQNAVALWPNFINFPPVLKALFVAIIGGFFLELLRFFALDKIFTSIRSFREGIYFSLGWNGVATFLFGIITLMGVFSIYALIGSNDLASLLPNASSEELKQIQTFKEDALELIKESPIFAFAPLIERSGYLITDIALTLLILLGFRQNTTRYIWFAALLKTVFIFSVHLTALHFPRAELLIFLGFGFIAGIAIFHFKKQSQTYL